MKGNNLREEAKVLCPFLETCSNLTVLNLSGNALGTESAKVLGSMLLTLQNLNVFSLSGNNTGILQEISRKFP